MRGQESDKDKWCRERVLGVDNGMLFPVARTKGMQDCVRDWHGYYNMWQDFREDLLANTEMYPGGLRVYREQDNNILISNDCDSSGNIDALTVARLKHYEVYLCSDGKLRYKKDPEVEEVCKREADEACASWWSDYAKSMIGMGYEYVDEESAWYNKETGDWACY